MKHKNWLLLLIGIALCFTVQAQVHHAAKGYRLLPRVTAGDSTGISGIAEIQYDGTSDKIRFWNGTSWFSYGTGNLTGTLTAFRIPFASDARTLDDDLQLTYDPISNTLSTSTFNSTSMSQHWIPFTNVNDDLVGEAGFEYNASGNVLDVPKIQINTGVTTGTGLSHGRAFTGSIDAVSTALVTVTLGNAMADTNYTVSVILENATATEQGLTVDHVETISTTQVKVRVRNNDLSALSGTLHVIAIHD